MGGGVEPVLVGTLVILGAWAGLGRLEPDVAIRARTGGLAGIAAVALLGGALGMLFGPAAGPTGWVPVLFTAQLAVAAWIDRQTTWVPDTVLFALCLVAALAGAGQPGSPVATILAGWRLDAPPVAFGLAWALALAGSGVAAALWQVQVALGRGWLTPPDIVAFALPLAVFGPSGHAAAAYALTGVLALGVLRLALLRRVLVHPAAAAEGARDLGLDTGTPVPALMLVLPSLAAVYLAAG